MGELSFLLKRETEISLHLPLHISSLGDPHPGVEKITDTWVTLGSVSGCNAHISMGMNKEAQGWNRSIHRCFYVGVQGGLMIAEHAQYWVVSSLTRIMRWCCWEPQNSVHLRSRKCCSETEMHLPQKQSTWTYLHQKWTKKIWTDGWHRRRLTTKAINRIFSRFCVWGFFLSRHLHELKTDDKPAANYSRTKILMISLHETYSAECFILQTVERNCDRYTPPAQEHEGWQSMKKTTTFMWGQKTDQSQGQQHCTIAVLMYLQTITSKRT